MIRELKGWHVAALFVTAFGIIISVNLTLAVNAVRSFPGLEVKNTYVASQAFDRNRVAQLALGWEVSAEVEGAEVVLRILRDGTALAPKIERATFGRATSTAWDQELTFHFDGAALRAPVAAGPGNWNLRLRARAADGTLFEQRIVLRVGA